MSRSNEVLSSVRQLGSRVVGTYTQEDLAVTFVCTAAAAPLPDVSLTSQSAEDFRRAEVFVRTFTADRLFVRSLGEDLLIVPEVDDVERTALQITGAAKTILGESHVSPVWSLRLMVRYGLFTRVRTLLVAFDGGEILGDQTRVLSDIDLYLEHTTGMVSSKERMH